MTSVGRRGYSDGTLSQSTSGNAASPSLRVHTIGRRRLLFTLCSYLLFVRFALNRPTSAQFRPVSILSGRRTWVGLGAPRSVCRPGFFLRSNHTRSRKRLWTGFARGSSRTIHLTDGRLRFSNSESQPAPSDVIIELARLHPAMGFSDCTPLSFLLCSSTNFSFALFPSPFHFLCWSASSCFGSAHFRHSVCFWGGFAFNKGTSTN